MPDIYNALVTAITNKIHSKNLEDTSGYTNEVQTAGNMIYIIIHSPDKYDTINFQFIPNELMYDRKVNVQPVSPVSRNLPYYHYAGGETTMKLRLDIVAEQENRADVINKVRRVEALGYSDGYEKKKPRVSIVWGSMFRGELWEVGNVKIKLQDFKPSYGYLPQQAYVDIDLMLVSDKNLRWSDITEEIISPVVTGTDFPDSTQKTKSINDGTDSEK